MGVFLDITLDFLFYASIPLALVLVDPGRNGLAEALLIYSFIGTGCTLLAFAVLAAKRGATSTAYPGKSFCYLSGLTESTETVAVFVLVCILPDGFGVLAYGFTGLCALTTRHELPLGLRVPSLKHGYSKTMLNNDVRLEP